MQQQQQQQAGWEVHLAALLQQEETTETEMMGGCFLNLCLTLLQQTALLLLPTCSKARSSQLLYLTDTV